MSAPDKRARGFVVLGRRIVHGGAGIEASVERLRAERPELVLSSGSVTYLGVAVHGTPGSPDAATVAAAKALLDTALPPDLAGHPALLGFAVATVETDSPALLPAPSPDRAA